jgi:hypothetical protein
MSGMMGSGVIRPWEVLATAVLACAILAPPVVAQAPSGAEPAVSWRTDVVDLAADSLSIEASDLTFTSEGARVGVDSDPGGPDYWTLEAEWNEQGREQRLHLYFGSDGTDWWVDEIRTRDGYDPAEWIYAYGPFFKTPLGEAYEGDVRIDLLGEGRPGDEGDRVPGVLTIKGLRLEVAPRPLEQLFVAPPGGGVVATSDPFEPGGPLHCSDILLLDPRAAHERILEAGYRVSYRLSHPTKPAEVLLEPPEGMIEGSALGSYGEIVIFVRDPSLPVEPGPTMPPECQAPSPSA